MGLPEITSDFTTIANQSPKGIAAMAVLRLYEKYFDYMASNPDVNIDRMTAALLISCPEKEQRERMWKRYIDEISNGGNQVSASVYAAGDWYQYMSYAMGLTEVSTGAW